MELKKGNFITIPAFACQDLKLSGNDLIIYSLIYGFTQDGENWFTGSSTYIEAWTRSSRKTVYTSLKKLMDEGLIIKKIEEINGVTFNRYKADLTKIPGETNPLDDNNKDIEPCASNYTGGVKITQGGCVNFTHNNIANNNIASITDINISNTTTQTTSALNNSTSLLDIDRSSKNKKKLSYESKKEKFLESKYRIMLEYNFNPNVQNLLNDFFQMLAEKDSFVADITIKSQLDSIANLNVSDQISIIKQTISRGWGSLDYMVKEFYKNNHASFDTSRAGTGAPVNSENRKVDKDKVTWF